jgi:hypothetical protein
VPITRTARVKQLVREVDGHLDIGFRLVVDIHGQKDAAAERAVLVCVGGYVDARIVGDGQVLFL